MALTVPQLQTLKADIAARGLQAQPASVIAGVYNATASPTFTVWKTRVTPLEMIPAYDWAELDTMPTSDFESLQLLLMPGYYNPSDPNTQAALSHIFAGASLQVTRQALIARSKRSATVGEKLFATGTGSDASPATMSHEGPISISEIDASYAV